MRSRTFLLFTALLSLLLAAVMLVVVAMTTGRVVTRDILLQEVWGLDYYGGTRTVDVHIRRLRAKLGSEHEQLIGTVRNVGYRFDLVVSEAVPELQSA